MEIRKKREEFELDYLSDYAAKSRETRGRRKPEKPCDIRTDFQRDRDRIIHSKAFRRLKHKTQVFISPEGDHYRTRLTHTLEVSQIARTIARALMLNEDLTEGIALGHDLGHTPFGHAGEEALDSICRGGFSHNEQSLRVVDFLEVRKGKKGLNLTYEVRDGILNHTGDKLPETMEGKIVRIADRIAYINHDIDDALRAGIIKKEELPVESINILGDNHSERIDTMVKDMINSSLNKTEILRDPVIEKATNNLREFLFDMVYIGSLAKKEESKAQRLINSLYEYYQENADEIPEEFKLKEESSNLDQMVIDYIAGMSDRYAINRGRDLLIPSPWVLKN